MMRAKLGLVGALCAWSLVGCSDSETASGEPAAPCTVSTAEDGSYTMRCPDGSSVSWQGAEDSACSVTDNEDGSHGLSCPDGTSVVVGQDTACTASVTEDGRVTVRCPDGSELVVDPDSSCSIADNGDGSRTVSCPDGTQVVVDDRGQAPAGSICWLEPGAEDELYVSCADGQRHLVQTSLTYFGDFFVTDLDSLKTLRPFRHVTGDISVQLAEGEEAMALRLPHLERVDGVLSVDGAGITALELPLLRHSGGLRLQGCADLVSLDLRALDVLAGDLTLQNNLGIEALELELLSVVDGDVNLEENPALQRLALPALEAVRLRASNNLALASLSLGEATEVSLDVEATALLTDLELGPVESLDLRLVGSGVDALRFPLASDGSIRLEANAALHTLEAPAWLRGSLQITDSPLLTALSLDVMEEGSLRLIRVGVEELAAPRLSSAFEVNLVETAMSELDLPQLQQAESFYVRACPSLLRISTPQLGGLFSFDALDNPLLQEVALGTVGIISYLNLINNPELRSLEVASLRELRGQMTVHGAAALERLELPLLDTFEFIGLPGDGLSVTDNAALAHLQLPPVARAEGPAQPNGVLMEIAHNPLLPECLVGAFFEDLRSFGSFDGVELSFGDNRLDCECESQGDEVVASCEE